jgi:hypothetical protein
MALDSLHNTEYYTGAQVRIYFGHILIDEIASIEWAGSNTKRPVYGYASTLFDAIAQGQYLVQGTLVMPFKEVGFLYATQKLLRNQEVYQRKIEAAVRSGNAGRIGTPGVDPQTTPPRATITTEESRFTDGDNVKEERTEEVVTSFTASDLLEQEAERGGQSFQDLVDALEGRLWDPTQVISQLRRADEFDLDPSREFIQSGFNILVTFGDVNNPNTASTAKTLIDVHFTGDQRIVDTGDNLIYEQYTFFCRSADEALGAYRTIGARLPSPGTIDPSEAQQPTPSLRTGPLEVPVTFPELDESELTPAEMQADRIIKSKPMLTHEHALSIIRRGIDSSGSVTVNNWNAVLDRRAQTAENPNIEWEMTGTVNDSSHDRLMQSMKFWNVPSSMLFGSLGVKNKFRIVASSRITAAGHSILFIKVQKLGTDSGAQEWIVDAGQYWTAP